MTASTWRRAAKRAIDVVGSAAGLVALSPLLGAVSAAIVVTMGRPVLFRHVRPGLRGRPFTLLKFRTLRPARPGERMDPATDERRATPLGRLLRATSLDELPQLWNVLRGDMSLVGPRPLLPAYLAVYTPEQARRHEVRPGLTGWAQVHGRRALPFSRRLALDVWYVDHWSLGLDAWILVRTVAVVALARGVLPGQRAADVDDLGLAEVLEEATHAPA